MFSCQKRFQDFSRAEVITEVYELLYNHYGPQDWWPGDSQLEIIIGAILTQAVNWKNVEQAIANLQTENLIQVKGLQDVSEEKLAQLIKPAGYYNMKAKKLKAFINYLDKNYDGQLAKMFAQPIERLRVELLNVYGIGPETADSILLYAGDFPVFVVDAYTKRIFNRLGLISTDIKYHTLQKLIMDVMTKDVSTYNEYHALLVALGKDSCYKSQPECESCPLS